MFALIDGFVAVPLIVRGPFQLINGEVRRREMQVKHHGLLGQQEAAVHVNRHRSCMNCNVRYGPAGEPLGTSCSCEALTFPVLETFVP
jgi:hypothetical protein